ncbi:hypothetical protein C2G38_2046736 [Gigaspora rosea]|uniref:Uncharacterized protein n=1 Tax=Gigaspora rosea TaxID=44941 RepID=A0A397UBT5_9GLOM|nr:hypothetical protein C2G38_2046736 [Gigaspora rosea]
MKFKVDHVRDQPIKIKHADKMIAPAVVNLMQDIYTNVVKCLFAQNLYLSQQIIKESLKDYLDNKYPEFNISTNEFTNRFHMEWLSRLLAKMKNYRSAVFQNVRNSIWKIFGVEKLTLLKSNAGASEIVMWKQSVEVADCFRSLFVQNESGAYWIDLITRNAFSIAVNDYNSGGPSYGSAEAIMDKELEANEHRSQMNSPQTDYAPEPLS